MKWMPGGFPRMLGLAVLAIVMVCGGPGGGGHAEAEESLKPLIAYAARIAGDDARLDPASPDFINEGSAPRISSKRSQTEETFEWRTRWASNTGVGA